MRPYLLALALIAVPAQASAQAPVVAHDDHANDFFGQAFVLDGDRLAVGATGSNAGGFDAGRVHVYVHEHGRWRLEALLHNPADEPAYGHFGRALALAGDTLVVGAANEDADAATQDEQRGSVHVYTHRRRGWRLQTSLVDPDTDSDSFGRALALAGDTLAVASGERLRDGSPLPAQIRIFRRDGDAWHEQAQLELPGDRSNLVLGDGTLLVASGPALFAFRRDGDDWREDPSLTVDSVDAFAGDGDAALVFTDGSIRVYRDDDGAWSLADEFVVPIPPTGLALRGDRAALGFEVPDYDSISYTEYHGVALWHRVDGAWTHVGDVDAPPERFAYTEFGDRLAVNDRWLVSSDPYAGVTDYVQSGAVYVFANTAAHPQVARFTPDDELDGCGCSTGGAHTGLLAGLLALGRRRRRPR